METLKQIPSGFFDAIARIAPGAMGLVAYLYLCNSTWENMAAEVFGTTVAKSALTTFSLFILFSYVLGQLISPFAKLFQRIGESIHLKIGNCTLLKKYAKAPEGAYDYLRMKHPAEGAQCAKIRAEFTMHNGFGVVILASILVCVFLKPFNWLIFFWAFVFLSTLLRGRTVLDTYNETVEKFFRHTDFQDKIESSKDR